MTRAPRRLIVAAAASVGALAVVSMIHPEVRGIVRRFWTGRGEMAGSWARDIRARLDAVEDSLRQSAAELKLHVATELSHQSRDWGLERGDVIEDLPRLPHGGS